MILKIFDSSCEFFSFELSHSLPSEFWRIDTSVRVLYFMGCLWGAGITFEIQLCQIAKVVNVVSDTRKRWVENNSVLSSRLISIGIDSAPKNTTNDNR